MKITITIPLSTPDSDELVDVTFDSTKDSISFSKPITELSIGDIAKIMFEINADEIRSAVDEFIHDLRVS